MSIQSGRSVALSTWILACCVAAAQPVFESEIEPNDSFPGELVTLSFDGGEISADLASFAGPPPDLIMRSLDELGNELAFDDNSSSVGDGFAPALFDQPLVECALSDFCASGIAQPGELWAVWGISGVGDTTFLGDHGEEGAFEVFVTYRDDNGAVVGALTFDADIPEGGTTRFAAPGPAGATRYDIEIDNTFNAGGGEDGVPGGNPDTVMDLFVDGEFIDFNDDGSFFGDGFASGIQGVSVMFDQLVDFAVSGFDDFDFDGTSDESPGEPHGQLGAFEVIIDWYDEMQNFLFSEVALEETFEFGDEVFFGTTIAPEGAFFFDINIDNTVGGSGGADVDWFAIEGLEPGVSYDIELTALDITLDTLLRVVDPDTGMLLDENDQGGEGNLSKLQAQADMDGRLTIGVTGYPDFSFEGAHSEAGSYSVVVTPVSSGPCSPADFAAPFGALDFNDIEAFVSAFLGEDAAADLTNNESLDFEDIEAFVSLFLAGCL